METGDSSLNSYWNPEETAHVSTDISKMVLVGSAGYVGSYLFAALESQLGKRLIGVDPRHGHGGSNKIGLTHQKLDRSFLSDADVVLFFGGVSSVGQATRNPGEAFFENTLGLFELFHNLDPKTQLIYASSASVYSQSQASGTPSKEGDPISGNSNAYDASKLAGELSLVGQSGCVTTGLRMGTVSGASPSMRWDLVFNAMVRSATKDGFVTISNPQAYRSILFLSDLLKLIIGLVSNSVSSPRILNAASHSATIGMLGKEIAEALNAEVVLEEGTSTYDFIIDTELSNRFSSASEVSIPEKARQLSHAIRRGVIR